MPPWTSKSLWVIAGALSQLSVAVALPACAGSLEVPHSNCVFAGQVITGAVVSLKVMVWTQVASLPEASVAFHVRWMPAWPVQFAAIGASLWLIAGCASHTSVAVALPVFDGSVEA